MKKLYAIIASVFACGIVQAQPILSNGFGTGTALINGTNYQKTMNIGSGNFGNVSASADGQFFYVTGANTTSGNIYYISVTSNTIVDSIAMPGIGGDMSSTNLANTVFSLRNMAVYRLNPQTKTIDSVVIGGKPNRIEERPNSKEAWVAADSMIYIVDYSSGLSVGTPIDVSSNKFDNADVRFTKGGTLAYKAAGSAKKIYKIDCAAKTIIDSIDTTPLSPFSIEVSSDSSTIYAANGTNVYMYSVASKALVDSMVSDKQVMTMYTHPIRQELWAVHHFADSVTVFNETNKATLASFDIGNDPFFLAFATGTVSINDINKSYAVKLYPNPATIQLNITLPDNKKKQLAIYDVYGRRVVMHNTATAQTSIDISALATGTYYLSIYSQDTLLKTMQFVKE